jgi:hypothetical protein
MQPNGNKVRFNRINGDDTSVLDTAWQALNTWHEDDLLTDLEEDVLVQIGLWQRSSESCITFNVDEWEIIKRSVADTQDFEKNKLDGRVTKATLLVINSIRKFELHRQRSNTEASHRIEQL